MTVLAAASMPLPLDDDWVVLTLTTGHRKAIRRSQIESYGGMSNGFSYIDFRGNALQVRETVEEIAELVRGPTP